MKPLQLLILFALFVTLPSCAPRVPPMVPDVPTADESAETLSGYLSLSDGTFHTSDERPPQGFYIKGYRHNWKGFVPTSGILGKAAAPPNLNKMKRGWMELATGDILSEDATRRPPRKPFVRGYILPDGSFYPSPPKIFK